MDSVLGELMATEEVETIAALREAGCTAGEVAAYYAEIMRGPMQVN